MLEQDQIQEDGGKLASKYGWDGLSILQVCEAALTDVNFHHEAEIIDQMIQALKNGDQPAFTLVITVPDDGFPGVELDPISGLPEYLFRNDEADESDEEDENNGNYSY